MLHRVKAFILLLDIYTFFVWVWMAAEFFSKGQFKVSVLASTLYITLVGAYVGDKEILRLNQKYTSRNQRGELFVLLWLLTLIIITCVASFWGNGHGYHIPQDLPIISGTVLIFWLITERVKSRRKKKQ
ncbi:MAG: hypothetical protein WCT08_02385 [Patescibacteria group bacterium]|jgi:hypothetical protein